MPLARGRRPADLAGAHSAACTDAAELLDRLRLPAALADALHVPFRRWPRPGVLLVSLTLSLSRGRHGRIEGGPFNDRQLRLGRHLLQTRPAPRRVSVADFHEVARRPNPITARTVFRVDLRPWKFSRHRLRRQRLAVLLRGSAAPADALRDAGLRVAQQPMVRRADRLLLGGRHRRIACSGVMRPPPASPAAYTEPRSSSGCGPAPRRSPSTPAPTPAATAAARPPPR